MEYMEFLMMDTIVTLNCFYQKKKTGMIEEERSILYRDDILKCKT